MAKKTLKKDSKPSIEKQTIGQKKKELEAQEKEPGLFEYAVIFGVVFALCFGLYWGLNTFYESPNATNQDQAYIDAGITDEGFVYKYEIRNALIQFVYDLETLEQFNFKQDLTKEWLYTHRFITVVTPPAIENLSENVLLLKSSGKFVKFMQNGLGIRSQDLDFKTIGEGVSCQNATEQVGIIVFNYTTNNKGVSIDSSGNCVQINAGGSAIGFVEAVDKIMYDLVILDK